MLTVPEFLCAFFLTVILALPGVLSSQDAEPLLGTWRLNLAESTFLSGPPQYKRLTCKIEPWDAGLKVTYDMIGVRGGVTHWEWIGRLDGNDYSLQGVDEVVTNAYSRNGDRTYTVVVKLDGRTTASTRIAISPDSKVMTVTSPASNAHGQSVINTAIYHRQ